MTVQARWDFSGQTAIVTGAGGDIGRDIALRFAREGANVIVVDVNLQTAQETQQLIEKDGGSGMAMQVNLLESDQIKQMVEDVVKQYGRIDILVNNAGIGTRDSLMNTTEQMWDLIMAVDTGSVFRCTKYVAPQMIEQGGGRIINNASLMGMIGMGAPAYSAAKGGIISMTPIVAAELGPHKINFNTICPGFIVTKLNRDMLNTHIGDDIIPKIPLRRYGSTKDTAALVSFLASEDASYITGAVIPLDGGMGRFLDLGEEYRTYDPFKDMA
jgi:3-oxoacyl-[acyl-carrier protein] reductase